MNPGGLQSPTLPHCLSRSLTPHIQAPASALVPLLLLVCCLPNHNREFFKMRIGLCHTLVQGLLNAGARAAFVAWPSGLVDLLSHLLLLLPGPRWAQPPSGLCTCFFSERGIPVPTPLHPVNPKPHFNLTAKIISSSQSLP